MNNRETKLNQTKLNPNRTAETEIEVDEHYQKVTLLCVDFPFEYHKEVFFSELICVSRVVGELTGMVQ